MADFTPLISRLSQVRSLFALHIATQGASATLTDTLYELAYKVKVGSINSIFYFLHKAAEPFNCLEQDNLA